MGMLEICSHNSYWRGLDYFENKRVKALTQISRYEFEADVEGTEIYHVHIDVNHPRMFVVYKRKKSNERIN